MGDAFPEIGLASEMKRVKTQGNVNPAMLPFRFPVAFGCNRQGNTHWF
jgi:hypothetical protein